MRRLQLSLLYKSKRCWLGVVATKLGKRLARSLFEDSRKITGVCKSKSESDF